MLSMLFDSGMRRGSELELVLSSKLELLPYQTKRIKNLLLRMTLLVDWYMHEYYPLVTPLVL